MKKLAIVFASLALAATPVFACPHSEEAPAGDNQAPRTAEKDKKDAKGQDQAKAKPAEKDKTAKPVEKDKTAKPVEKKTDKVSSK